MTKKTKFHSKCKIEGCTAPGGSGAMRSANALLAGTIRFSGWQWIKGLLYCPHHTAGASR